MPRKSKTATPTAAPRRRRDAAATRIAILASARDAFARSGYDGAGVREIASGAGVTAMLVNRYFGSKENLFAEAVAASMATTAVVMPRMLDPSRSAEDIAAALIGITNASDTPLEGFQIMLRSASSSRATEIGRELIERHQLKVIAVALGGKLAPQRAALMLSVIAGFQLMRQTLALSPLADANPKVLAKLLGPVLEQIMDGERRKRSGRRPT
jgi:AcrR family transcriptional regulator